MQAIGYDLEAFTAAIVTWVAAVAGPSWKVIRLNENGTRPPKPYLTVNVVAPFNTMGTDSKRWGEGTAQDGADLACGQRILNCELQSYGVGDAMGVMGALQNSLQLDQFRAPLVAAGLSPGNWTRPTDITTSLETERERRAHMEVEFFFASNALLDDGSTPGPSGGIKTVGIEGKYNP